jgi:hypothetical protein
MMSAAAQEQQGNLSASQFGKSKICDFRTFGRGTQQHHQIHLARTSMMTGVGQEFSANHNNHLGAWTKLQILLDAVISQSFMSDPMPLNQGFRNPWSCKVVSKIPAFWSICHSVITKTFTFPP